MEVAQNPNVFPIQIRHDVDGWYFQPKEYNEDQVMWLYECPHCGSQLIVQPYIEQPPQEEQPKEIKHKSKKSKEITNSEVSGELVPLSPSQSDQQNQQQEQAIEASQQEVELPQSVTETEQEQTR